MNNELPIVERTIWHMLHLLGRRYRFLFYEFVGTSFKMSLFSRQYERDGKQEKNMMKPRPR